MKEALHQLSIIAMGLGFLAAFAAFWCFVLWLIPRHGGWSGIIEKIAAKKPRFRQFHERRYLVDFCVRWDSKHGHGGPMIIPPQMRVLAELDIDLWFDVYVGDLENKWPPVVSAVSFPEAKEQPPFFPTGFHATVMPPSIVRPWPTT